MWVVLNFILFYFKILFSKLFDIHVSGGLANLDYGFISF